MLHCLRTAPCFLSHEQHTYDELLKDIVSNITNICFLDNSPAWAQATLPVNHGGLGFRSAVDLAPSAYLASTAASTELVHSIVPHHLGDLPLPSQAEAEIEWSKGHNQPRPDGIAQRQQKSWDNIKVASVADTLLQTAPDSRARSRLLAASARESGAWLNALPVPSLGLRMDDEMVRVAVGLRLGAALCRPHACHHCGSEVNALGTHGLSCQRSQGRHMRHAALNDIIHSSLATAKVPSRLEPSGLQCEEGKWDGVTIIPWKGGKQLAWDATSPDTFAPSYVPSATSGAGAVAEAAESRKRAKYSSLNPLYSIIPIAIESSGACGPRTMEFLKELGERMRKATGEESSFLYLLQRLSVAVQRGNALSILGTSAGGPPDLFY